MVSGAARLRALVGARGGARCVRCGLLVLAGGVDVDHLQPLALGGEDVDSNVQVLCRDCHGLLHRVQALAVEAETRSVLDGFIPGPSQSLSDDQEQGPRRVGAGPDVSHLADGPHTMHGLSMQ
ncbi:HNH endonuclease [Streptomyces sp. NBC_00370]